MRLHTATCWTGCRGPCWALQLWMLRWFMIKYLTYPLPRNVAQRLLMARATHAQMGSPGLVAGSIGVPGVQVAVVKAAVGLAGHALWCVLRQQPGCRGGVEEGGGDPPCCKPRGPAACACRKDRSDRCLSFAPPRLESAVQGAVWMDSPSTCGGERGSDAE